jgi:superfamily II DNA/RNA helicase
MTVLHDADRTSAGSFADLGVPAPIVEALNRQGLVAPFAIQTATLPDSLAGRDVLGRGRTGSGKTLAFALPMVARLAADSGRTHPNRPRGLVLVPTRELATQVHDVLLPLAASCGLTVTTIFGGVRQTGQVRALDSATDIVVACPGRLEDLMRQGYADLRDVEITVLDEADHMADLGFLPVVRRILDSVPRTGQRLLFSATLDNGVDVLVRRYLTNPVTHSLDDDATTEPDMEHHVLTVSMQDKPTVIRELASGKDRSVLFTRTKHSARKLARDLTAAGIPAVDLHGNLSQNARDRNLTRFRDGEVRVLVATDVAARGIHVDDIALVVHVDPPTEHKAYLHRSGRTARAGASGLVVTLQTSTQRAEVTAMTRKAGISAAHATVTTASPEVLALTGPHAARVEPAVEVAAPKAAARPTSAGRRRSGSPQKSRRGPGGQGGQGRQGRQGGQGRQGASRSGGRAS